MEGCIYKSPGLFVRAAIQMIQTLHDKGIDPMNVDFIFVGLCVTPVCEMLQNLIMMVEPEILRPNIRFLGQVDDVMNVMRREGVDEYKIVRNFWYCHG